MKKLISMALVLVFCISVLTACSGGEMSVKIPDYDTLVKNLEDKGYVVSSGGGLSSMATLALYDADDAEVNKILTAKKDGHEATFYFCETEQDVKIIAEGYKASYLYDDPFAIDGNVICIGDKEVIKDVK